MFPRSYSRSPPLEVSTILRLERQLHPQKSLPKTFVVSSQVKYVAATNAQALHPQNLSNNEILEAARCPPDRNFSLKSHRAERLPMREISHPFTKNATVMLFQSDSSYIPIWAHRWRQGCERHRCAVAPRRPHRVRRSRAVSSS